MPVRSTTGGGTSTGGATFSTTQLDVVTITYAGAGGQTFNTTQLDVATITFNGAGGFTPNTTQLDVATISFAGAGGVTINNAALDLAVLNFVGAGGMTIGNVALNVVAINFAGAGGMTVQTTQLDVASILFAGQGGLFVDAIEQSGGGGTIWFASALFAGQGGLFVNAIETGPPQILPRPNNGKIVVCDATFGATYGAVPFANEAFTLIVNTGQSLSRVSDLRLRFVGPNAQVQFADIDFLFLGTTTILLEKQPIQPFEYLWYQADTAEFNAAGPWQVFVESDLIMLNPQQFSLARD